MEIKGYIAVLGKQLLAGKINIQLHYKDCFILLLISTFVLLTACESAKIHHDTVGKRPDLQEDSFVLSNKNGDIEAIHGWINSETLLYSKKSKDSGCSQLMTWNLNNHSHSIFYQPSAVISTVSISPSKAYVIVSTTSNDKIQSTILNKNGDLVYSISLPAFDITYEWNPYNGNLLFLSTFAEDWSFNSYIVDVKQQSIKMLDFPQPFAQWDSKNGMMFLDWEQGESKMTAPLVRKELDEDKMESIMLDIANFKKMKHTLLTIQEKTDKLNRVTYAFYNNMNQPFATFSVPTTKSVSDLIIPYYDVHEQQGDFFTFVPENKMKDSNPLFSLIKFNWKTEKRETIIRNMKNEPISCTSDGDLCLYGFQFNKMIDVKNHKIIQIYKAQK